MPDNPRAAGASLAEIRRDLAKAPRAHPAGAPMILPFQCAVPQASWEQRHEAPTKGSPNNFVSETAGRKSAGSRAADQ